MGSNDTPAPVVSVDLTAGDWTKGLTLGVELVRNGGLGANAAAGTKPAINAVVMSFIAITPSYSVLP